MKIFNVSIVLILMLVAIGSAQDAPQIVSVMPAQNALGVPISTSISVTFDRDMDIATINANSFIVNSSSTGLHQGEISYNEETMTASLVPGELFRGGEVVTAVLTTEIQSAGGVPLESNFVWSFTANVPSGIDIFAPALRFAVHDGPLSVFAADFNGDHDLDIATANKNSADVSVIINNGDSTFTNPANFPVGEYPTSLSASDLDGDGDIDLACPSLRFDNVSILLNTGSGNFAPQQSYPAGDGPMSVVSADLDGDGDIDLATANLWSNDVSVLLNNGDGTFGSRLDFGIGGDYTDVASRWQEMISSIENQKLLDLLTDYPVGNGPHCVSAGDLDKDGDIDLATANFEQNTVSILLNNGDATFESGPSYPTQDFPASVCVVDLNGDFDLDLICANLGSNTVSVFMNDSEGGFVHAEDIAVGELPIAVAGGDLDGDQDIDVVVANSWSNDASVLYNDGTGTFPTNWTYEAGETPYSVHLADITGNGAVDLVSANSSEDSVSVLFNVHGCDFYVPGDFNYSGFFNVADILDMHSNLATGNPPPGFTCDCDGRVWGVVGDVNNSCEFNIADVVDGFSYLKTGSPPVFPCDQCLPSHP